MKAIITNRFFSEFDKTYQRQKEMKNYQKGIDVNSIYVKMMQYHLSNGVYDSFPILKARLEFILNKINALTYVVNAEPLSVGEIKTLEENDYLERDEK